MTKRARGAFEKSATRMVTGTIRFKERLVVIVLLVGDHKFTKSKAAQRVIGAIKYALQ